MRDHTYVEPGTRYPDLNEPVVLYGTTFVVVNLGSVETVECPICGALVRKPMAKKHWAFHNPDHPAATTREPRR